MIVWIVGALLLVGGCWTFIQGSALAGPLAAVAGAVILFIKGFA